MDKIADMTNILNNFFNKEAGIIAIAKESSFIKRQRKITPINFLRSAITTLISEETASLRDYAISFKQDSSVMLSKNAIQKKFSASCVKFLENTLKYLCKITFSDHFKFALLPGVNVVNIVDSSEVRLNDKLQNEFPGMRQFKSLLKVQTIIDCLQGNFKKLEITQGRCPDQGYKGLIECVEPGTLLISDLGYFSCETMKEISDKNGYFLTRYKRGLICYEDNGNEISLASILKNTKTNIVDINILAGKQYNVACRLIAIKLNEEEYNKRLLNIKRQLKRRQTKKNKVEYIPTELDKWTILLTNLTIEQLKAEKAWDLYALRWQIELFFKLLKGEMNLTEFTHGNINRIKSEIYLKYIVLVLLMMVTATITAKEISLMKAVGVIKKFCTEIFSNTYKKIYKTLSSVQFCILSFCKKDRRMKRPTSKEKLGWTVIACA